MNRNKMEADKLKNVCILRRQSQKAAKTIGTEETLYGKVKNLDIKIFWYFFTPGGNTAAFLFDMLKKNP